MQIYSKLNFCGTAIASRNVLGSSDTEIPDLNRWLVSAVNMNGCESPRQCDRCIERV